MNESRRFHLKAVAGAVAAFFFAVVVGSAQEPRPKIQTPSNPDDEQPPNLHGKPIAKIRLEESQKDIKKNVERLFDLASQLKEQVEKTDATEVLSLAMVKKAEEIEKLARSIKDRAKG